MSFDLGDKIRDIPDFPKQGIVFKDIMPLLADPEALHETVERLAEFAEPRKPDLILGAEARGFILGAALAYRLGCGFAAARKPGRLPWRTVSAKYELEYGFDVLELHADAIEPGARVLIHDDLLATGGTARAKVDLVEQLGGEVVGLAFVIELDVSARPRTARRLRRLLADPVRLSRIGQEPASRGLTPRYRHLRAGRVPANDTNRGETCSRKRDRDTVAERPEAVDETIVLRPDRGGRGASGGAVGGPAGRARHLHPARGGGRGVSDLARDPFDLDSTGEFWAAMGILAAAGLVLGLSQLFGGWTKWGVPV